MTYVGSAAAGNFVKMVHNGIEYALMQGIAEIYDILRYSGLSQENIQSIFRDLNTGILKSFLLDITVDILGTKDTDGSDLLTKISDIAGSKGTGSWTVEAALKIGVPVPTIAESLFARWMSARNHNFHFTGMGTRNEVTQLTVSQEFLRDTLELVYLGSYLQGLELIQAAEKEFSWGIDLPSILRIWQGGCIIRSRMLEILPEFYGLPPANENARDFIDDLLIKLDHTSSILDKLHIPTPVI